MFLVSIVSIWNSISLQLPDSVEAEVKNAINRGFDGIIVYEDKKGEKHIILQVEKTEKTKFLQIQNFYLRLQVLANCMLIQLLFNLSIQVLEIHGQNQNRFTKESLGF